MNRFSRAIVCFALALAGGGVFAFPGTSSGPVTTFGGKPVNIGNVGAHAVSFASDGTVLFKSSQRYPTPGGGSIPIDVTGGASRSSVAAALGRFAGKALPVLGVGVALYDLGQELGFRLDNSAGSLQVTKQDPEHCSSSCFTYRIQSQNTGLFQNFTAASSACAWAKPNDPPPYAWSVKTATQDTCTFQRQDGAEMEVVMTRTSRPPDAGSGQTPSTVQELSDAIAAKSGWPTSSALARATTDAIASGESLHASPQSVTGPATSPGPSSTTHNITNNTTKVSISTHQHTYAGPSVATTTVTNTSTVNNSTQEVIDEQETTDVPEASEQEEFAMPCGLDGLPACKVKVDETGMPTAENIDKDRLKDLEDDQRDWLSGLAAANPFPSINWNFALPTACGVIPTPAFEPALASVDVCQFQPMFHELMTVVWMLGGLFGAISLFMKSSLSQ